MAADIKEPDRKSLLGNLKLAAEFPLAQLSVRYRTERCTSATDIAYRDLNGK